MVQWGMNKTEAIEFLGGTVAAAAQELGVTYTAVNKWPDPLPRRIADRVVAAVVRRRGLVPPDVAQAMAAYGPAEDSIASPSAG